MHAYLIDPFTKTIERIETSGKLQQWYELIDCNCVCNVNLPRGDALILDDDGLARTPQAFFRFGNYRNPLAGRCLVVGSNLDGDTTSPRVRIEAIEQAVTWIEPQEAQRMHDEARAAAMRHADEIRKRWPGVEVIHAGRSEIAAARPDA